MQPIGSGLVAGKKLGNRVRFQSYRASYEIPGAISEGESNESSIVASSKGGILRTSKGDNRRYPSPDPLFVAPSK